MTKIKRNVDIMVFKQFGTTETNGDLYVKRGNAGKERLLKKNVAPEEMELLKYDVVEDQLARLQNGLLDLKSLAEEAPVPEPRGMNSLLGAIEYNLDSLLDNLLCSIGLQEAPSLLKKWKLKTLKKLDWEHEHPIYRFTKSSSATSSRNVKIKTKPKVPSRKFH
jgi:hypothetical protein